MEKRIVLTLDPSDDKDLSWLPEELTVTDWLARGMLVLIREASKPEEAQD